MEEGRRKKNNGRRTTEDIKINLEGKMLSRKLMAVSAVLFVTAVCYAAQDAKPKPEMKLETVLATIDGVPVTKDALYTRIIQLYPAQAQDALDRMVNEIMISNEAERKKVTISDREIKKKSVDMGITGELSNPAKDLIRISMLADKMIIEEFKIKVTPEDVKTFFEANKAVLGEPEQVRLRQIYVLAPNEANDISLSLNAGADFAKMAQAKSMDTASKDKGGDLGYFTRGMILPEIEKVAFEMKVGEISQPIKGANGYHIVKLEGRKPAKEAKFDNEMKKRLEIAIKNIRIQQAIPVWLDGLRKKAEIK
ncbi:MAG: peptidylprolyl isomerase [Elusimicrobiota bacterium]